MNLNLNETTDTLSFSVFQLLKFFVNTGKKLKKKNYRVSQKSEFYRIEHMQIGFPPCYGQPVSINCFLIVSAKLTFFGTPSFTPTVLFTRASSFSDNGMQLSRGHMVYKLVNVAEKCTFPTRKVLNKYDHCFLLLLSIISPSVRSVRRMRVLLFFNSS